MFKWCGDLLRYYFRGQEASPPPAPTPPVTEETRLAQFLRNFPAESPTQVETTPTRRKSLPREDEEEVTEPETALARFLTDNPQEVVVSEQPRAQATPQKISRVREFLQNMPKTPPRVRSERKDEKTPKTNRLANFIQAVPSSAPLKHRQASSPSPRPRRSAVSHFVALLDKEN